MADFFNFTDDGIEFKGFQDIRTSLKTAWQSVFGSDIDLSETSPDGHHVDLEAKTILSVAEGLQTVVTGLNRSTATGQSLDFLAAFIGLHRADDESDASLRSRMDNAETQELATPDGMITYLQDNIGPDISVTFNYESETVDGIEPHAFRVTIPTTNTTSDADIGKAIWHCAPAGIKSSGSTIVEVTDAAGKPQNVYFSRPSDVTVDIAVTITRYKEEAFPTDGENAVVEKIKGWATGTNGFATAEYKPGVDVIPARLFFPILFVSGIQDATIKVRKSGEDWGTDIIKISADETVVLGDVSVTVSDD